MLSSLLDHLNAPQSHPKNSGHGNLRGPDQCHPSQEIGGLFRDD